MTLKTTQLRDAITFALTVGTTALMGMGSALAQENKDATTLDRVEVTGSRIKRVDTETASPVFVIDREAIKNTGAVTIGEFLQRTPAIMGAATNPQVNNGGGAGAATVDLRGLGVNRSLVLVDGRRWIGTIANANGAVDVNSIPITLVERVEVLKDGASAIYGSDAMGGVVNFILRRSFDGVEVSAFTGVASRGDAETTRFDGTMGMGNEKGNIMFGVTYNKQGDVRAGDRPFSSQPFQLYAGEKGVGGTSRILTGRYVLDRDTALARGIQLDGNCAQPTAEIPNPNIALTRRNGAPGTSPGDFRCFNGQSDVYNFQADGNLDLTPQERVSMFINGNYQLGDFAEAFIVGAWNKTKSRFRIAPLPFDGRPAVDNVPISANSLYNPFGVDITDARLRLRDFIPTRETSFETDTYQFTTGLRGNFGESSWSWDAAYSYGRTPQNTVVSGYLYSPALKQALGPSMIDPSTGRPICVSTPGDASTAIAGCLPVNFFGPAPDPNTPEGQAQLAALRLINPTIHNQSENDLKVYSFNATGDLFDLPAGKVSLAVGLERREESASSSSDFLTIIPPGETVCLISQEACTFGDISGKFDVNEAYGELLIPLLADKPFAQKLNLSVGTRYSDYSLYGSNTSSKVGIEWKPFNDLLIRGTYADVFRAPTIGDLFGPTVPSANTYIDPCNGYRGQGGNAAIACQNVPTSGRFVQGNSQVNSFQVSNPNMKPEEGSVITAGFVYSPSWLEGFSLTVDVWKVEISDFIVNIPETILLNQCYRFGRFCDTFSRDENGDVVNMINQIDNFGKLKTRGVDIGLRYAFPETSFGQFSWNLDTTYLQEYEVEFIEGNPTSQGGAFPGIPGSVGFAGTFVDSTSSGFGNLARWRALNDIRWSKGDWNASLTSRYVHHVDEAPDVAPLFQPDGTPTPGYVARRRVPSWMQHDIQVGFRFDSGWENEVQIGIRNVTDKLAPLIYSGFNGTTDMRTYDAVGRFFWMRYTARF